MVKCNVVIIEGLFFGGEIESGTFHLSNVQNVSLPDNFEIGDNQKGANVNSKASDSPDDSGEPYEEEMYP